MPFRLILLKSEEKRLSKKPFKKQEPERKIGGFDPPIFNNH